MALSSSLPKTRSEIMDETGIPRTTIFDALERLTSLGKAEESKQKRNDKGRYSVVWKRKE